MSIQLPNIPSLSSKVDSEVRRAFDSIKGWLNKVGADGGMVTNSSLSGSLSQAITDNPALSPLFDGTIPPQILNVVVTGSFRMIMIQWDSILYKHLSYVEIWRHTSDNLGAAQMIGTTISTMYSDTPPNASLTVDYYYWVRAVSTAGLFGPFNATAGIKGNTANDPAYVLEVLKGQLGYGEFAAGVYPVRVVASLPVLPATLYPQGVLVLLTTDNQLYRSTGTAWTLSIPAVNVTGQLTDAQIAAVAAAKVSGQLTDAQISAIAAAKMTGQITSTQITDDAVTTAKIAANAITATEIAAGAVVAGKIAALAITSAELSAGAITAGKIAAGAIVAGDISAGAITAGKIAADAVTANEIAAGAITASELSANAVTAGKIATGAIIAGDGVIANAAIATAHIIDGTITNAKIGTAAVDAAKIANATITTAKIGDGQITNAKIGDTIQSTAYTPGSVGWSISKAGAVEFNGGTFRGAVVFSNSSSGYANIADRPTSLSALDSTAATKLGTIATGAQVNPANLAALDGTAATKLSGIAAGATNTTNTNQLTDGANLGGTAAWTGVSSRPTSVASLNSTDGTTLATAASNASSAASLTSNWVKPGQTTIDGNKIYTGDAFIYNAMIRDAAVGTLSIAGDAVTLSVAGSNDSLQLASASWASYLSITVSNSSGAATLNINLIASLVAKANWREQTGSFSYSQVQCRVVNGAGTVISGPLLVVLATADLSESSYISGAITRTLKTTIAAGSSDTYYLQILDTHTGYGSSTGYAVYGSLLAIGGKR